MRKYVLFSCILSKENKFSLGCVRCKSIKITPSSNPSFSLSSFVSSWNKSNLASIIGTCMSEVDNHKSRNKTGYPFICLNFDKIINPIAVVHVTESFVFHRTICADKGLKRIGKIVIITKVKIFASKHILKTFDVNFVFWCLLMPKTIELNFLNLKDFSMVNLPNDWSLGNNNKIIIDLHFYDPINCFYRYFLLIKIRVTLIKLFDVTLATFLHG